MSESQEEFERRLRTWLDSEGRRGAPAGLAQSVLARTAAPERGRTASSRRNILVGQRTSIAAALVVGLVIGAIAVGIARPSAATVASSPAPTPGTSAVAQATATPAPPSASPTQSPTATPADLGQVARSAPISGGQTYQVSWFSAPLQFTEPSSSLNPAGATDAALIWHLQPTIFKVTGYGWAVTFADGDPVRATMCHPDQADRPSTFATTEEVDRWLRSAVGMTVSPSTAVTIDGRPAQRWDVKLGGTCWDASTAPPGSGLYFGAGEDHRVYAVPSPAGIVLIYTWSDTGDVPITAVNKFADQLLKSIHFVP
jgi:hypothetical protein